MWPGCLDLPGSVQQHGHRGHGRGYGGRVASPGDAGGPGAARVLAGAARGGQWSLRAVVTGERRARECSPGYTSALPSRPAAAASHTPLLLIIVIIAQGIFALHQVLAGRRAHSEGESAAHFVQVLCIIIIGYVLLLLGVILLMCVALHLALPCLVDFACFVFRIIFQCAMANPERYSYIDQSSSSSSSSSSGSSHTAASYRAQAAPIDDVMILLKKFASSMDRTTRKIGILGHTAHLMEEALLQAVLSGSDSSGSGSGSGIGGSAETAARGGGLRRRNYPTSSVWRHCST